jgi:hypothetical protein
LTGNTDNYQRVSDFVRDSARSDDFLTALESFIDTYKEAHLKKDEPEQKVPASIFAHRELGVLEALVKYLKENLGFGYSKIAQLINRDERTVWTAYKDASEKLKSRFVPKDERHQIPCSVFHARELGPLEVLAVYLRDHEHLSFQESSALLNRNYRTVWLSYRNGMKKGGLKPRQ